MSQKELARRLAGSSDFKKVEAKRRWLAKIFEGKIKRPGMAEVERVLSLPPGYFQLPTPQQARLREDHLKELEAEVARLRELHDSDLRGVLARLARLEAGQVSEAQREDPPSTRRKGDAG